MEKRRLRQKSCSDAGEHCRRDAAVHRRRDDYSNRVAALLERALQKRCSGAEEKRRLQQKRGSSAEEERQRGDAAVMKRRGSELSNTGRVKACPCLQTRAGARPSLGIKHGPGTAYPWHQIKHGPGHGLPFVSNTGQASLWTAPFSGGITLIRDPPTGERNDSPCFRGHRLVE